MLLYREATAEALWADDWENAVFAYRSWRRLRLRNEAHRDGRSVIRSCQPPNSVWHSAEMARALPPLLLLTLVISLATQGCSCSSSGPHARPAAAATRTAASATEAAMTAARTTARAT